MTEDTFETCVSRGICGCPKHDYISANARGLADISGIHLGELVAFFVKGVKEIRGFFQVTSEPFYDETPIWESSNGQLFPYRVQIQPCNKTFEKPISLSDLYDLSDKDVVWSWRGIEDNRDCIPFTDGETEEILRLLSRSNPSSSNRNWLSNPYSPTRNRLPITLDSNLQGRITTEGAPEASLMAWLLSEFAHDRQKEVFGNYSDYTNFVPTSYRKELDILLLYETDIPKRVIASFTIIELKADRCELKDLSQTIKYEDWLIKKMCDGDSQMVRSVIIAHRFDDRVVDYVRKREAIEGKTLELLRYFAANQVVNLQSIVGQNQTLLFP